MQPDTRIYQQFDPEINKNLPGLRRLQEKIDLQRTRKRATDDERSGVAVKETPTASEAERWWPREENAWTGRLYRNTINADRKRVDGMSVPELTEVPDPRNPKAFSHHEETFFAVPEMHMVDDVFAETKRLLPPPAFDPNIDNLTDEDFLDAEVTIDILRAVEDDRRRLEAFGNPMMVHDTVDALLQPTRESQENMRQRQEFNGFVHWGLLHAAHMALEDAEDASKAHQFVNRYLRDVDLFAKWLEHPTVVQHIKRKLNMDIRGKFDKLMSLAMAYHTRAKLQSHEGDVPGALKSLSGAVTMIDEGGDPKKNARHRKAYGAILAARGGLFAKMDSLERSLHDLTTSLAYLDEGKAVTVYQVRADVLERLGRVEEARADEERAATMWERADVIRPGLRGEPRKFVN